MVKEGNKRHVKDTTLDLKPSKCKTAINYVFYLRCFVVLMNQGGG